MVATGLWVWIDKLITRLDDEKAGRQTLVMEFDLGFSGRDAVLGLALLLFMTVLMAVLSGSIPPLALVTLLLIPLAWKIVVVSWKHHANPQRMLELRKYTYLLHLAVGIIVAVIAIEEGSHFHGMCDMGAHHWSNDRALALDISSSLVAAAH